MSSFFGVFGSLEGPRASPGALWGPLGRQGAHKRGPMSEKLVRWTPLGSQFGVILASFFEFVLIKNAATNMLIFY